MTAATTGLRLADGAVVRESSIAKRRLISRRTGTGHNLAAGSVSWCVAGAGQ
ncbi:hypothetical protein [Rhodococcoides fascians]|uniref:hypothetical protein n=1 Tax=Rhodococcoides fascians TaxID=1828 RepID=UPI0012D2C226|nr:hypothetical protein [Rhodococcus fascians]